MKAITKKEITEYKKISKRIDLLYNYDFRSYNFSREASWCADRINWAWKFRKISREQMEELADRMVGIFESTTKYYQRA